MVLFSDQFIRTIMPGDGFFHGKCVKKERYCKKLELLSELDVQNELNYQELAREIESVSNVKDEYNRLFWRSDYMVQIIHPIKRPYGERPYGLIRPRLEVMERT